MSKFAAAVQECECESGTEWIITMSGRDGIIASGEVWVRVALSVSCWIMAIDERAWRKQRLSCSYDEPKLTLR